LYLTSAIEGREAKKLSFTKYLSTAIDSIAQWGLENQITKEQLSHLTIETLKPNLRFKTMTKEARDELLAKSSKNSEKFYMQSLLEVPSIISSGEDLIRFSEFASSPNFFGNETISAPVLILDKKDQGAINRIKGNLVLIESADPGYDWIFSKEPAGLITLFGGKNSHMAIRCMELNLPAAIGVGRSKFEKLSSQETAHLDPKSRRVV
jgi:phosphohistidine swiveling domain-containing protein